MRYELGTIVWLKSGGPPMTIVTPSPTPSGDKCWTCMWHDNTGPMYHTFPEACLALKPPQYASGE